MNKHNNLLKNADPVKLTIVILLALNLVLALYISFFKKDALWVEILKAGGNENFEMVQQLYNNDSYKTQQTQTLKQVLGSMNGEEVASPKPETNEAPKNILDKTTLDNLFKNTLTKGSDNARFVILEYSDLLCPYCQRHHNDRTLQKIVEKYPDDVALIFKNMPLVQLHPTAFLGAEGVECAGKLGGSNALYNYLDKAFVQSSFDNDNVNVLAKELGLNEKEFASCISNREFKTKIDNIITEARTVFGINGTPGNVIIEKETGKYVIVNGAHPFEKFDTEIQNLMK